MQQIIQKIKSMLSGDVYVVLVIVLVGFSSFGLGRLSLGDQGKMEVKILEAGQSAAVITGIGGNSQDVMPVPEVGNLGGQYVASKKGTKYHLPWCAGASQMAEENKVWFDSKEAAEAAGYSTASNCKGI